MIDKPKEACEITRNEWIAYEWVDMTTDSDPPEVRTYVRGRVRPIEDSVRAAQEWDTFAAAYRAIALLKIKNGIE